MCLRSATLEPWVLDPIQPSDRQARAARGIFTVRSALFDRRTGTTEGIGFWREMFPPIELGQRKLRPVGL